MINFDSVKTTAIGTGPGVIGHTIARCRETVKELEKRSVKGRWDLKDLILSGSKNQIGDT